MMGRLSKLIVVDNLGCPKCKRNSAEFLEKKIIIYPQIKRICWNLLTLIVSGLLHLQSSHILLLAGQQPEKLLTTHHFILIAQDNFKMRR
jgi:hypothetical protein